MINFYWNKKKGFALLCVSIFLLFQKVAVAEVRPFSMPRYITFCGKQIDTSKYDIRERLEVRYYAYFRAEAQTILWMKRTKRYFPIIEKTFSENGIPDDLKYAAVVESALVPKSYSSSGAVGIWQFIEGTGKKYGLIVKRHYDERRDVYKATLAAAKYFKFLYEEFGSWQLALAAYNIGEKRVEREVDEQDTNDFFEMMFPIETDDYVMNIIVVKHIMEHPELYNLNLDETEFFTPYDFNELKITVEANMIPVSLIANAAKTSSREIKTLNPQIIGNFLYKGSYSIRIPKGQSNSFKERYAQLLKELNDPKPQ